VFTRSARTRPASPSASEVRATETVFVRKIKTASPVGSVPRSLRRADQIVQTFIGTDGFRFLDEREMHLTKRWFHYSPPETFSHMFRSPDWALWQGGEFEAAIQTMCDLRKGPGREADRTQVWAANGVDVVRLQVVDAESIKEPESPLNYLLTYLAVTHPGEDRLIIDGDKCAANGIALPDIDFLIHDDDAVFTKYEGEPSIIYRGAYFNRVPDKPGEDDDRPMFHYYAELADGLLARRDELSYEGPLFGIDLLHRLKVIR
jgi:hypothetical protein